MATPKKNVSGYFVPTTSAVPCRGSRAPSASRVTPSPVGSKKEETLPKLSATLCEPDPLDAASTALERAEKSEQAVGLGRPVPRDPPGGRLRRQRPLARDLSETVDGHPRGLSRRPLLQRLPGGVPTRHPRRAAHGRGQGVWPDGSRRAVEQHAAATARTFRQEELVLLQVRHDARVVPATLPARLQ